MQADSLVGLHSDPQALLCWKEPAQQLSGPPVKMGSSLDRQCGRSSQPLGRCPLPAKEQSGVLQASSFPETHRPSPHVRPAEWEETGTVSCWWLKAKQLWAGGRQCGGLLAFRLLLL
jgi:hypothetical protein